MWQGPVHPDVIALNSALSACASANRWEVAMQLGRAMAAMGQGIYGFFGMSQENPKKIGMKSLILRYSWIHSISCDGRYVNTCRKCFWNLLCYFFVILPCFRTCLRYGLCMVMSYVTVWFVCMCSLLYLIIVIVIQIQKHGFWIAQVQSPVVGPTWANPNQFWTV